MTSNQSGNPQTEYFPSIKKDVIPVEHCALRGRSSCGEGRQGSHCDDRLLSEYATLYPHTNVHFYLECDRFCSFIEGKLSAGYDLGPDVIAIFNEEHSKIKLSLTATYTRLAPSNTRRLAR